MKLEEKRLSSQAIYKGGLINLRRDTVELGDGTTAVREVVEHPGGVCVAALDEENNVYLVRQFRYPFGRVLAELPAGKLDFGEDPDAAAARELGEETGLIADRLVRVGEFYPSAGYLNEILYLYVATGLHKGATHPDEGEFLECYTMPLDAAVEAAINDEIKDGKTKALLLLAQRLAEKGRGE